jgi:hypothetical protein
MKKVKFIKQPTGRFNLAYSEGEVAELNEALANELIEFGYAVLVEEEKSIGKAVSKDFIETPEKKKAKK